MRWTILLLAGTLLAGCSDQAGRQEGERAEQETETEAVGAAPERYIGRTYPPVPSGLEQRAGAVITPPEGDAADAEYAFAEVIQGDLRMLWLSELLGRDAEGEPTWEVVDAIAVPPVPPEAHFLIYGCEAEGQTGIAALVTRGEGERLSDVRQAWTANREAGRIEEIAPAGITCQNPELVM